MKGNNQGNKYLQWYILKTVWMWMDRIYRVWLYLQALHLQEGPSHCLIKRLKLLRLSVDFISFGKQFQIWGPMALRLLEPKVTWFGRKWFKLLGFREGCFEVLDIKILCIKDGFKFLIVLNISIQRVLWRATCIVHFFDLIRRSL